MFVLVLNDMRAPRIEYGDHVAKAATREDLVAYYVSLLVGPYSDGKYSKYFKKGSPLEWYNPINDIRGDPNSFGHGIHEMLTVDAVREKLRVSMEIELEARVKHYVDTLQTVPDVSGGGAHHVN